jgi:hypothetical protein
MLEKKSQLNVEFHHEFIQQHHKNGKNFFDFFRHVTLIIIIIIIHGIITVRKILVIS